MRAMLAEHAQSTVRVAEGDKVLAEEPHPHRRPVALGDLFGEAGGQPVTAHQLPHRRLALDPAEQVVLLRAQHALAPRRPAARMLILGA